VNNAGSLKNKIPEAPAPSVKLKRILLEVLFFVALAAFGFSVVLSLIGESAQSVVKIPLAPDLAPPEPAQAAGLYEAASHRPQAQLVLSPIFTPSVQYWEDDLLAWSGEHNVDPDLAATVMQIESCGNPSATSSVGAMGLFQVMPFHFEVGEDPYDPDTNANRGLDFLAGGLETSGGHAGLALAGYNGGHSVINRGYDSWAYETQRYYRWGSGIYREASAGWSSSPTLAAWLSAGGASLCQQAEEYLGFASEPGGQAVTH
jgi:soluble lytic murein transglycosylase-like protein